MDLSPRLLSGVVLVLLASACGVPPTAPSDVAPPAPVAPPASSTLEGTPEGKPDAAPESSSPGELACRLPAPVKSNDPCSSDADCGPSSPCHAKACVAKAKSQPSGPDTICTKSLECDSADANRCGCYEGRCALIPPSP